MLRALMDQRRTDAEGGRVLHQGKRARKLAVVVAVQSVLVAACLLFTLHVYWKFDNETSSPYEDFVHIQFDAIKGPLENSTLKFAHTRSSAQIDLNENKDKIVIKCTGPYVLHMDVCYKEEKMEGMLQLQVVGRDAPVSSFPLQASHEVCSGLHSLAYLRVKEVVSLHLYCRQWCQIKNVTVGLSYLLGKNCAY